MKKYKVLLTGKNTMIIDDFFNHMSDEFELLTTSTRLDDMERHVELFEPDLFVYCLNGEVKDKLIKLKELKRLLTRKDVITVIIGSEDDCNEFNKVMTYMSDLTLLKPITVNKIREELINYITGVEKEREEQKRLQEKLAQLKTQQERKHVLVVDDDPVLLKVIKEYLHDKYDVATAISGKIARKFLDSKKTNFILLDYEMPVENGVDVLEWIRGQQQFDDIPVVFFTGTTNREKILQALSLKPQGYLLKPIDKDKLLGTIEKFIG